MNTLSIRPSSFWLYHTEHVLPHLRGAAVVVLANAIKRPQIENYMYPVRIVSKQK